MSPAGDEPIPRRTMMPHACHSGWEPWSSATLAPCPLTASNVTSYKPRDENRSRAGTPELPHQPCARATQPQLAIYPDNPDPALGCRVTAQVREMTNDRTS